MLFLADFSLIEGPSPWLGWGVTLFILFHLTITILALIDLFRQSFRDPLDRTFWLLAIVLTGILGASFYFWQRKNQLR